MPRPKPRTAEPHEVHITREGTAAVIEFVDGVTPTTRLTVAGNLGAMTDAEVLAAYNRTVEARREIAESYVHVAVEVPVGSPQLSRSHGIPSPRGDVLRCVLHDDGEDGPIVEIDDTDFAWEEFGAILRIYAGWGMRLVFVPDDEIADEPIIEIREPND